MAKRMAILNSEIVVNMTWCANYQRESSDLKDVGDKAVNIGDTYLDGQFYRNGKQILTKLEIAQQEIEKLNNEKISLENSYKKGVNSL